MPIKLGVSLNRFRNIHACADTGMRGFEAIGEQTFRSWPEQSLALAA